MYKHGTINKFWNNNHTLLDYNPTGFKSQQDVKIWLNSGFKQENLIFDLYDMSNPTPEWALPFLNYFGGENVTLSFMRMNTNTSLPYHSDLYKKYIEINKLSNPSSIARAVVFLEDWQPGHILEIDGSPISQWHAGDYVIWNYDTPHMAANLGIVPRYTAQITFTNV